MSSVQTRKLNITFREEPEGEDYIPRDDEDNFVSPPCATAEATTGPEPPKDGEGDDGAEEEEEEFIVEAILNKKTVQGVTKYLIKWEGYDESYNTWEPLENLDCEEILEEFEKQWAKKHTLGGKPKRKPGPVPKPKGEAGANRTFLSSNLARYGLIQSNEDSNSATGSGSGYLIEDDNSSTSTNVSGAGAGAGDQLPIKAKSLSLVMREENGTYGLDRGLEPQLIIGTCSRDDEIFFLVLWKDNMSGGIETQGDMVLASELWAKYPEFVMAYFENHKSWVPGLEVEEVEGDDDDGDGENGGENEMEGGDGGKESSEQEAEVEESA